VWPGVLQIEAIGQAGLCLAGLLGEAGWDEAERGVALTHVLGARFVRPVTPAGDLEIVSRMLPDGLFTIFVGQCLQRDAVCCVASVRGINQEAQT
jgi:3-hydroxymyristoyl/3-hydroxydecanoyl-(acyl carrier protein) dehydratase